LWSQLCAIARRIQADHSQVQDVRVFGSIARGDHVGTSDVDVLIILTSAPAQIPLANPVERGRPFYPYFTLPIGIDLLVYTIAEIERGNRFISHIYEESVSLL